jgi:hypothetical protein
MNLEDIAKLWNQPRCPSTNEYIKKVLQIPSGVYSVTKDSEIVICRNMNGT